MQNSKTYTFKRLVELIKTKINRFNLNAANQFLNELYGFKYLLNLSPGLIAKNGFTTNHVKAYKPVIEDLIIKAVVKQSDLLNAEQLPGQTALFGLGKPFDDARLTSQYIKDNISYQRQQPIKTLIKGKTCQISFALNKIVEGNYVIIDTDLLQPSHIGNIQNPLHFIPEAQPRNRATSQSGHNTPKLIAENLRPAELVEGATAFTGAPIINTRGEVIQGNGRAYTIKYYYANFPNDPKKYINWLNENLACYNFKGALKNINKPVIVRMVNINDNEAIALGQYTQKDLEAVANETTQIKSKVGLISDTVLDTILNNLLQNDTGDLSLSELIRNSDILKLLIKENIIRGDDLEIYTRNNVINETGVNFITKLLLNLIFKDGDVNTSDVFLQLPIALQKSIEKSALYILKCRGEQSINLEISKAILGLRDYLIFKPNGSIINWQNQVDIFGTAINEKYNALEIKLIEIFADSPTQKQITETFKNYAFYATTRPGDMFEEERPAFPKTDAVKKVFGITIIETNSKSKAIAIAKVRALALSLKEQNTLSGFTDIVSAFNKKLIEFKNNNFRLTKQNDYFLVAGPNSILKDANIPKLPIILKESVVRKALGLQLNKKDIAHQLKVEDLIDLPKFLQNPIAIFKSETATNSIVVITEIKDFKKDNTLVSIRLNTSFERININNISSIHTRTNKQFKDLIKIAEINLNIFYLNKEKMKRLV